MKWFLEKNMIICDLMHKKFLATLGWAKINSSLNKAYVEYWHLSFNIARLLETSQKDLYIYTRKAV